LPNTDDPRELINPLNKEISKVEVEEITIEDVEKAIRNLKKKKKTR
jgi:PHP family Zn ribbon phosphoesterase